jgi:hypothetical protein
MCLFCTMKRRQVFRGLAAVAVGGVAQAVGSAGDPWRRCPHCGTGLTS